MISGQNASERREMKLMKKVILLILVISVLCGNTVIVSAAESTEMKVTDVETLIVEVNNEKLDLSVAAYYGY